jgi:hypothetical protein
MSRFVGSLVAVSLGFSVLTGCGAPPAEGDGAVAVQRSALTTAPGNTSRVKSVINTAGAGKCMDVAGGGTALGTPIVQYSCHTGANQKFELRDSAGAYKLASTVDPSKCVGFNEWYADNNVLLRLVSCENLSARWYLGGDLRANPTTVTMRSALGSHNASGGCVDIASGSGADSLWLQIYACHGGPNQQWLMSQ